MPTKKTGQFGVKGTLIIIVSLLCYMFGVCFGPAGMSNTVLPLLAQQRGWDYADMLAYGTWAGWIAVLAAILWCWIGERKGCKFVICLTLVFGAGCLALFGTVHSFLVWGIVVFIARCLSAGYFNYGAPAIVTNWFPRKKGMALGWASMGVVCCDVFWTPNIGTVMNRFGIQQTLIAVSVFVLVFAILLIVFLKNLPEEAGAYPDNEPVTATRQAAIIKAQKEYVSEWTFRKLLKTPQVWIIGVGMGALWMCSSLCIVSCIPRLKSLGYDVAWASKVFMIAGVCSLVGSWLFGFIDQKKGTKKATLIYGIVFLLFVLILFFLAPLSKVFVCIGVFGMLGTAGGTPNLISSYVGTIWGRWDYSAVNKVVTPMVLFMTSSGFVINSWSLKLYGNYNLAFVVAIVCTIAATFVSVFVLNDKYIGKRDEDMQALIDSHMGQDA